MRAPGWPGLIRQYGKYLPVTDKTPVVTLLEGGTPLIPAPKLSKWAGGGVKLYLKYEGLNPTGSFKDRGMTMAISKAKEEGAQAVVCASTGNTAASAAAYAARAGIPCIILIPKGAVALGKLAQGLMHGAKVLQVLGNFDDALTVVRDLGRSYRITIVNSINPYRIEGQKTGAFEICDVLGKAPAFQAMPVGNAGNITAYWKGYREYLSAGKIKKTPVMLGFQAAGSAPIVHGKPVADPHTIATAIKIGNPASWKSAVAARDQSGGLIRAVTDDEILAAYRALSSLEGVFCEPASAAGVAGVRALARKGYFRACKDRTIACILTGHGLKDPSAAISQFGRIHSVPPTPAAVAKALGLKGR
ncbi:MAG: threonine synthase [Candidatus Coatesbacteria bacterium]